MARLTNGGVSGKDVVAPTLTSGIGKWNAQDQQLYKQQDLWPRPLVIGDYVYGGYYAGIIDTTTGNIIATDAFQTGAKYALIISPKSLQSSGVAWKTTSDAGPNGVRTRWNGLGSTQAMGNSATYPAAQYCYGLSYPSDGGSMWYIPAMDELELLYRNFKPYTNNNYTSSNTSAAGTFPFDGSSYVSGANISSSPSGSQYTTTVPAQTSLTLFQTGGAQTIVQDYLWSSTEHDATYARYQSFHTSLPGGQGYDTKRNTRYVRPVRRVLL